MTWALDLDGVMWRGAEPIDGSSAAVNKLLDADQNIVFVTNNSYHTREAQAGKLKRFGIDAEDRIVSSAMAAATLVSEGERVAVLGGPGVVEAIEQRGAIPATEGPADAVIVGLDKELSYARLAIAVTAILNGARFIASNTDATYPTESGLLPGAGPTVAAVTAATGVEPLIAGKPHQPQADLVKKMFGTPGIMVGDRPETDGLFAQRLGYEFGLVLTGVTKAHDLPVQPEPSYIAKSLAELVDTYLDD